MQKMKFGVVIAAALSLAVSSFGVTLVEVRKRDLTSTQAIVRVRTDQPGFCTYRVSEGASFSALVNDVNPVLFSGANSDARAGSIITGLDAGRLAETSLGSEHVFVAGTRTATRASDGKFYSRSLQANTLHWVGVICGADAEVATTFQTLNPPLGADGPELMPFDPTAFGNVAVPSIDWANRSTTYNDPIMGTQLHRMTDPSDVAFYNAGQTFNYGISANGHWANPGTAIAAGSASFAVCDTSGSCGPNDPLTLIAVVPTGATNYRPNGAWDPEVGYLDFLVRMWGSGTDAAAENRTVAVCWSIDDQTCFTSSQNIVLPQTSAGFAGTAPRSWSVQSPWSGASTTALTNIVVTGGSATVNFAAAHGMSAGSRICINGIRNSITAEQGGNGLNGCHPIVSTPTSSSLTFASNAYPGTYTDGELIASPNFPQAQWASWGTPPTHNMVGQHGGGTVTATAGAVVLTSSGSTSIFDPNWAPGTKIYIAGSSPMCTGNLCTIASVTDAQHLTLVESLTIGAANWNSANFSLLVTKTTSTGAVSVSAGYDFVSSETFDMGLDGSGDICNSNYVTVSVDADGNPISPSVQGYLCMAHGSPLSQAVTPIYLFIPATGETRLIARNFQTSAGDYRAWVGWHPTNGAAWFTSYSGQSVFQVVYGGDFRAYTPGFPQNTAAPGTAEQLTFTDIFAGPGNDIPTQIANCKINGTCNNGINAALFGVPPSPPQTGAAIEGNYMVLCGGVLGGGQDSPGYVTMWNIGSIPAVLSWAAYSFDAFPVGYGGIHSCINLGNGQVNAVFINGNGGSLGGTMRGPWAQVPTMYNSGNGYVSNTSVGQTDGFECPAGLDARWQALGAKPVAAGGIARCLEFKVPGDFCSSRATAAESAAYPCPWNASSNYSLIKPIGEGDALGDIIYGGASYGEKMLVVKVTRNSPTDIDLLVFRYSNQSVTPNSEFTCGTYNGSEWSHANGWTMYALPFRGCNGSTFWSNATDSSHAFLAENPNILGSHPDFGQGSSGFTWIEGANYVTGYTLRANEPLPDQIGGGPTGTVWANPTFGSTNLPDVFMQSYPSKRQRSSMAPASEMDWALDVRHYNPSGGNSAETAEWLFGNKVTPVAGCTQTYRITMPGNQSPDPKHTGFIGWAGYEMLADASAPGTGSNCMDSTPWHYCYAYNTGECISTSTQGSMYASIPHDFSSSQCLVNSYAYTAPCISNNYPWGFWVTQFNTTVTDKIGENSRRLTSALVAPGRQYNFTNAKVTPDAKWIQVLPQWLEGQRTDIFWVKLPPFPGPESNAGTAPGATGLTLQVSGGPGDAVRVAFGYAENGGPANFYCTSRAEACYTSATATAASPFVYAGEVQSFTPCSGGCTVQIPAIPGRIVYYQVQRRNGSNTTTSALGTVAVQ